MQLSPAGRNVAEGKGDYSEGGMICSWLLGIEIRNG